MVIDEKEIMKLINKIEDAVTSIVQGWADKGEVPMFPEEELTGPIDKIRDEFLRNLFKDKRKPL